MSNHSKNKYKKSKTINLSEYIHNKQTDSNINEIKFDKFEKQRKEENKKDELRYLAENNRIMLTLGKFGEEASHVNPQLIETPKTQKNTNFSKSKSPSDSSSMKEKSSKVPSLIIEKPTTEELMMGAELNRFRLNNKPEVSYRSSVEPTYQREQIILNDQPVIAAAMPVIKKTKSILKLPSNLPEKSICFDERVDVIQISDSNNEQSSAPSSYMSRLSAGDSFLKVPNTG